MIGRDEGGEEAVAHTGPHRLLAPCRLAVAFGHGGRFKMDDVPETTDRGHQIGVRLRCLREELVPELAQRDVVGLDDVGQRNALHRTASAEVAATSGVEIGDAGRIRDCAQHELEARADVVVLLAVGDRVVGRDLRADLADGLLGDRIEPVDHRAAHLADALGISRRCRHRRPSLVVREFHESGELNSENRSGFTT